MLGDALAKERPAVVFTAARHERHRPHRIYEGGKIAWTRRTSSLLSKEQDNMVTCRGAALADCTTARLHSVLIE